MTEQWLPVVGYEGLYEVSNTGRVRSLDRIVITKRGHTQFYQGRELSPAVKASGHLSVQICREGRFLRRHIHRLVLEAFVGPCPEGMECCHNDGNPANNRVENLRWDTHSSNILDKQGHGTDHQVNKTRCPQGHEYTPEYTPENTRVRQGGRACMACVRESNRESVRAYRARQKASSS